MNVLNLVGNLTSDVELNQSKGGTSYCQFNIGVQRPFKDKQSGEYQSDFPRCKAFGKTAEIISEHFNKGSKIGITGSIQTGRYENQQGQTIYTTDVLVDRVHFVAPKGSNNTPQQQNQSQGTQHTQNQNGAPQGNMEQNPFNNNSAPDTNLDQLPF